MILTHSNSLESLENVSLKMVPRKKVISMSVENENSSVAFSLSSGNSFIVKIDPGVDPETLIVLYKFNAYKDSRNIDIVSSAGLGKAKYDDQQVVKLNFKKVQDGVYIISTAPLEEGGEYYFTCSPYQSAVVPLDKGFAFSARK